MCGSCYYAHPENYEHVAGMAEKKIDLIFKGTDIDIYNRSKELADRKEINLQDAFKESFKLFK